MIKIVAINTETGTQETCEVDWEKYQEDGLKITINGKEIDHIDGAIAIAALTAVSEMTAKETDL